MTDALTDHADRFTPPAGSEPGDSGPGDAGPAAAADRPQPCGGAEFARACRPPALADVELFHGRFRRHVYPRHAHPNHYCLTIVLEGAIAFECLAGSGVVEAGAILVVEPGIAHAGWCADGRPFRFRTLYFPARYIAGPGEPAPRFPSTAICDYPLFDLARQFHREVERDEASASPTLFAAILARLMTHAGPDRQRPVHPAVLTSMDFLGHDCGAEASSLDDLAARVGLHPVYLSRLFTRATGLPPHAYQTSVRLQLAKERLSEGDDPACVAADLGFTDQSHLSRLFKRNFGITPGAYASGRLKTYKTAADPAPIKS